MKATIVYYILAGDCSAVGDLENGNHSVLEGNGVDFASVVQYECDPGYETYGNITKYCKTDGMWSHTPPTCESKYCPVFYYCKTCGIWSHTPPTCESKYCPVFYYLYNIIVFITLNVFGDFKK